MANQKLTYLTVQHDIDPYEILELRKWATQDDIKKAYYKTVKKFSPEKSPEMFMRIRQAYDRLRTPERRAKEDILIYNEMSGALSFKGIERQNESVVKLNRQIKEQEAKGPADLAQNEELRKLIQRRSLAYASKELYREAHADWDRLAKVEAVRDEAVRNKIIAFSRVGFASAMNDSLDEAERAWKEILKLDPDSLAANHNLAILSTNRKRPNDERTYWVKTLRLWRSRLEEGDDPYIKALMVETHKHFGGRFIKEAETAEEKPEDTAGDKAGGKDKDKEATGKGPKQAAPAPPATAFSSMLGDTDYESTKSIGQACVEQKNWPQAVAAFEKCLQQNRDDVEVLTDLGWAYLNTGNVNKSITMLNRAAKLAPENKHVKDSLIRAHLSIGRDLVKSGMTNQAFVHYKKAQQLGPDRQDVNESLADAHYARGEYMAAYNQWEKIVRSAPNRKQIQEKMREAKVKAKMR